MVKVVAPELRLHSYPHELSGGMRQRVSSAAAIGCTPALLIADEPTTALDVTTQRQYLDLLMELQQATGMAIMFVTHDISLVGNMCDQLAVFYGGLLVEYGPRQQVLSQPSHPYTVALLQSIPQLGEPRERLPSIAGEPPDLGRLPTGCPFHPRCDAALDRCRTDEPPPVFTLAQGRQVRCWLREQEHERSAAGSA